MKGVGWGRDENRARRKRDKGIERGKEKVRKRKLDGSKKDRKVLVDFVKFVRASQSSPIGMD